MLKCPNCGQKTERTRDFACQWWAYPLIPKEYYWDPIVYLLAITGAETITT